MPNSRIGQIRLKQLSEITVASRRLRRSRDKATTIDLHAVHLKEPWETSSCCFNECHAEEYQRELIS